MLQVIAGIAAPDLRPWPDRPEGESGLALENGGLVVFTRGNLVVSVRSAGVEPFDARPVAARVDEWLIGSGTEPTASEATASPPGSWWLRWREGGRERTSAAASNARHTRAERPTVVTPSHAAVFSARRS